MRAVIVIVVLAVVLVLVGWVSFSSPEGNPTIRVNSEKVKNDTAVIVDKTKQAVENVADKVDDGTDSNIVNE